MTLTVIFGKLSLIFVCLCLFCFVCILGDNLHILSKEPAVIVKAPLIPIKEKEVRFPFKAAFVHLRRY